MKIEDKDILVYCPRCGRVTDKSYLKYCDCDKGKLIKMIEIDIETAKELNQRNDEILKSQKSKRPYIIAEGRKMWFKECESFVNNVVKKSPEFSEAAYKHRWINLLKDERQEIISIARRKYEIHLYGENYESTWEAQGFYGQYCPYCGAIELKKISLLSRIDAYLNMGADNPLKGRTHQCEFCGLVFKLIPRSLNNDFLGFYRDLFREYYDNDDDFSSDPYATHSPDYPITFSQCRLPKDKQL